MLPFAALFLAQGAFSSWVYYTLVYPNSVYTHRDGSSYVHGLYDITRTQPLPQQAYHLVFFVFIYLIPPLLWLFAATVTAWLVLRRRQLLSPVTLALAMYAIWQLRLLLHGIDESKLRDSLAPVVVLTAVTAFQLGSVSKRLAVTSAVTLTALASIFGVWSLGRQISITGHGETLTSGPLHGLPLQVGDDGKQSAELQAIISRVEQKCPDDRLLVLPASPLVNHLVAKYSPSKFDYIDPTYFHVKDDQELADIVSGETFPCTLVSTQLTPGGETLKVAAPLTVAALSSHFKDDYQLGDFTLLIRNGNR